MVWLALPVAGSEAQTSDSAAVSFTEAQIERFIEQLGSNQFASRERAATALLQLGKPIIPRLRLLVSRSDDPEVRIRAGEIVKQLTRGDMKQRVDAFLAGEDQTFEGWDIFNEALGDTLRIRELFIDLQSRFPELTSSLGGAARDKTIALEKVVAGVTHHIFVERKSPTAADVFALLIPATDPQVPLEGSYEKLLLAVLRMHEISKLYRDPQLSTQFKALVSSWLPRSSIENREEILFYGLMSDIASTRDLALRTLTETQQTEPLAMALQALSRFGRTHDDVVVAKLLDDTRVVAERGFVNGKRRRTTLGDVAMATIARLHDKPLTEVGFADDADNEKMGFLFDEIGFPIDDDQVRRSVRQQIEEILEPSIFSESDIRR